MPPSTGDAPDVGATALGAAEMRADEASRPDRLFDDPFAAAFVAAAPPLFPELEGIAQDPEIAKLADAFRSAIAIRTRFFDDYLADAGAAGTRQVVILAAGLDARAFRSRWPDGAHLFEVDLPGVLAFKDAVLAEHHATPRCARTTVAVDLRDDWPTALVDAGLRPTQMTAWLAEGLLPYLSADAATRLLESVGALSPRGSRLAFEYDEFADGATLASARAHDAMSAVTSLWEGGLEGDPAAWLRAHDWRVETNRRSEVAERYGRPRPDESSAGFVVATRS